MRKYRVAAVCYEPAAEQSIGERLNALAAQVRTVIVQHRPDLVVLPEMCLVADCHLQERVVSEPLDGLTVSAMSGLARELRVSVCIPIIEDDGGRMHNTAVYLDRAGRIAGTYRKRTPTKMELDLGILPGPEKPETVTLDGLRIGTAICYDENYPDLIWRYMDQAVDLLVFPSYTYGGRLIGNWALNCGVPLVCAFPWESVIYDRDGSVLAEGGSLTTTVKFGAHPPWIVHDLDMQSRMYHLDYNQDKIPEMMRRYGDRIDLRLMVREARMRIWARSDELDIQRIEDEMGLIPLQTYLSDTRRLADGLRKDAQ